MKCIKYSVPISSPIGQVLDTHGVHIHYICIYYMYRVMQKCTEFWNIPFFTILAQKTWKFRTQHQDMFLAIWQKMNRFGTQLLSHCISSMSMSKIKNRSRISQCDCIQSFNRGRPGCVNFYFVSQIHYKVLLLTNKITTAKKFQIACL